MKRIDSEILVIISSVSVIPAFGQAVYEAWVARYGRPVENSHDIAHALTVDEKRDVYVTGTSDGDYCTIKYSPDGDTIWVRKYNGPSASGDWAYAVTMDTSGAVIVGGTSTGNGTSFDWAIIRYSLNGESLWVRRYNGPGNDIDEVTAVQVDVNGNIYVTGFSWDSLSSFDYTTIKYSSSGNTLWVSRYNGPGNSADFANAIAVDDSGNVYVTGSSPGTVTSRDYATIKYKPDGDSLWVKRFNGPANGADEGIAIGVDSESNVYVTGLY